MVISSLRTYIWMEGLDKMANTRRIPVGISARHVHVSQEHLELLFGPGYELTPFKDLSQPGQYSRREGHSRRAERNTPERKNTRPFPESNTGGDIQD